MTETQPVGRKKCDVCGEVKLLSEFHFQRYKPLPGQRPTDAPRGRYRTNCKKCQRQYMRDRRIRMIEEKGAAFLDEETRRIRDYYDSASGRLEIRRAVDRARYSAFNALKARHSREYEELLKVAKRKEGVPDDYHD